MDLIALKVHLSSVGRIKEVRNLLSILEGAIALQEIYDLYPFIQGILETAADMDQVHIVAQCCIELDGFGYTYSTLTTIINLLKKGYSE